MKTLEASSEQVETICRDREAAVAVMLVVETTRLSPLAARTQCNPSPLPWLQRTGQLTNDRVLNVEVVDLLIHLRFRFRDQSLGA